MKGPTYETASLARALFSTRNENHLAIAYDIRASKTPLMGQLHAVTAQLPVPAPATVQTCLLLLAWQFAEPVHLTSPAKRASRFLTG